MNTIQKSAHKVAIIINKFVAIEKKEVEVKPIVNYYPRLNALRGIAIIMVLIQHFGWYYLATYDLGHYGVNLFFVLSGFLITGILINTKERIGLALRKFYGRRFLRIFPIYYATILILLLLGDGNVKNSLISLITYTFNFDAIKNNLQTNEISHLWSLSVEEQFYILWPFLLLPFRKNLKIVLIIIVFAIVVSLLQLTSSLFIDEKWNYAGTFPCIYFLCIGGASAIIFKNMALKGNNLFDTIIVISAVLLIVINNKWSEILLPFTWAYLITKSASKNMFVKFLEIIFQNKLLQKIGLFSYGIYIFHKPLAKYIFDPLYQYMYKIIPWNDLGKPLSYIFYNPYFLPMILFPVLSYFFAMLSYKYFEAPILKLKDRLFED